MAIFNRNTILMITKLHTVAVAFSFFLLDLILIIGDKKCSKSFAVYWRHNELVCGLLCLTLDSNSQRKRSSSGDGFMLAWLSRYISIL